MKQNKTKLRIFFLIMLFTTFIVIFIFSSQNGEDSSRVSKIFSYNILKLFINDNIETENTITIIEPIMRKIAHFSMYTLVGIWSIALLETFNSKENKKIIISELIGFLYACSDEIHQSFVGKRSASGIDVLIDSMGVLFGILLIILFIKIYENTKNKKKNNKILQ